MAAAERGVPNKALMNTEADLRQSLSLRLIAFYGLGTIPGAGWQHRNGDPAPGGAGNRAQALTRQ